MNAPKALRLLRFGGREDPLIDLGRNRPTKQIDYLRCYLSDLGARTILEEPNYFDRDYLAEFVAFYGTSALGYPNVCRRLHFFNTPVTRKRLMQAVGGNKRAIRRIQDAYLGHTIIRPIPGAPLGRTALRLYPDDAGRPPRVMNPARTYEAHLAGLTLEIKGLAWQQQDSAVGACATVAIWSMLHSVAFDPHHQVPTTADITIAAHRTASLGARVFPSTGLTIAQVLESIKQFDLSPVLVPGNLNHGEAFSRDKFARCIGSFIRSGYPVLLRGRLADKEYSSHVNCVVGFRSTPPPSPPSGDYAFQDDQIEHLYLHDDNLGPNVRFRIIVDATGGVVLRADAPPARRPCLVENPTSAYPDFHPSDLIVAVNHELRTDPIELQEAAITYAHWLPSSLAHERKQQKLAEVAGMCLTSRFIRLTEYLGTELADVLQDNQSTLAHVRLAITEQLRPLSLHIGLIRVSQESMPLMDILFDTSDSDRHLAPTAYVAFQNKIPWLLDRYCHLVGEEVGLGTLIRGW